MVREDAEAFLRAMMAPLSAARTGQSLPGVPFSREAVANAFVMLGLLPEPRAEEILAEYKPGLEAKGFRFGVLTGELSVRSGAHGFTEAKAAGRNGLTQIPLAVAAGPVPIATDSVDLSLTWATLTPGGVRLRLRVIGPDEGRISRPLDRPYRVFPGFQLGEEIGYGVSVADNLGRRYQVRSGGWSSRPSGRPGERVWDGEMLAEPEQDGEMLAKPEQPDTKPGAGGAVHWLELASASGPSVRVVMPASARVATGPADPPWPTPGECYLADLVPVTSMSIGADGATVELDTARIVAAVADALLWVGALPADSALLAGETAPGSRQIGWREPLMHLWGRHARERARAAEPDQAGLAVSLPLRQAAAVIESVTAHDDLVSVQLYGIVGVRRILADDRAVLPGAGGG